MTKHHELKDASGPSSQDRVSRSWVYFERVNKEPLVITSFFFPLIDLSHKHGFYPS